MSTDDLIAAMLREEGGFQKALKGILNDEIGISLSEFCQISEISQSTMYKILEEGREPNLRTIRQVYKALRMIETDEKRNFVAIIASHRFLEDLPKTVNIRGLEIPVRVYTIVTVEDAIVAAVRAERDGAVAIICAPIVEPTVQKIIRIPVVPISPYDSVVIALDSVKEVV